MSLTRKALSAMGIENEKIDQIIEMHTDTVNALKEERDNFKADADKLPAVQKELDELKKAGNKDDAWKVKYDAKAEELTALQKEFDAYKDGISAKETKAAKRDAYRALLKETGISEKRIDAVMKVSDGEIDKIELTEDGKIKETEPFVEAIKKEWADFIAKETVKGADTATPPDNNGAEPKNTLPSSLEKQYFEARYGKTEEK